MKKPTKMAAIGSAVVLMFGLAACGDDASGDGDGDASVSATPTDGDVEPDPASADAACGEDDDDAGRDGGGGASVSVVLTDGDMEPDPASADAGSVEIVAKNVGGDLHELVIVKGDDPAALPVNEDGAVIEDDLPECDRIGKIAAVEAGTEESELFDLDAGSYILFCNIVQSNVPPRSHFQDGMVITLTVT